MKRLAICLSIMIVLVMTVISCSPGPVSIDKIRHKHPPKQEPALEAPLSLLTYYNDVSSLIASRDYQDADDLLDYIRQANIPSELQNIIDTYTSLSSSLAKDLNYLESVNYEASYLFSQNLYDAAREKLSIVEKSTDEAIMLVENLRIATDMLSNKLGIITVLGDSDLARAYQNQILTLDRIEELIIELDQLREDLGLNPRLKITAEFSYTAFLEVSVDKTTYIGRPITITGHVVSEHPKILRTLNVYLGDKKLSQQEIVDQFSFQIIPPVNTPTGRNLLVIEMPPAGYHSGDSKYFTIDLQKIPIQADIDVPLFITVPQETKVSGKVYDSSTPIRDARVKVTFGESSSEVRTSGDGSFTGTVETAHTQFLPGLQEIVIDIEPAESEYALLAITRMLIPINAANMAIVVVASLMLYLLIFHITKAKPAGKVEEYAIPTHQRPELPAVDTLSSRYMPAGIKGRILVAYLNSLDTVEKITTIIMTPDTTLREYIDNVSTRIPAVIDSFTKLTIMTENTLYSSNNPDEEMVRKAEQLASTIQKELYSGVT